MAVSKSRLGRGLDSLISGGINPSNDRSTSKASKSVKKKAPAKQSKSSAPKGKKTIASKPRGTATESKPPAVVEGTVPFPAKDEETAPPPVAEPAADSNDSPSGLAEIPISQIETNPHQPRKHFDEESLKDLSESIRSEGLLQPIVVRKAGNVFQLIAGERRWRACQLLKMKRIPARIIEASDASSAVMSMIENLQRENLNPIEEALGYASLISDFKLTQESTAERVGKSRAAIANSLRLLQLEREIQQYITRGFISVGHAKVLLGLEQADERNMLARVIIERGLSVRETEKWVQGRKKNGVVPSIGSKQISPAEQVAISDLEKRLANSLNTRVQLKHSPRKGKIIIEYHGNDDLQRILEVIGQPV